MMLVELFARRDSLSAAQRRHVSERLIVELISAPGAPADLLERGRAMSWVVVHELDTWVVGGPPVGPMEPPHYLVRVTVPGGHLNDAMRTEVVARVTRVLAEVQDDPQRLYREADAWVHIIEVPDGNLGTFGRIVSTADLTRLVVDPAHRAALIERQGTRPVRETLIDPICGMAVELTDAAITLERDGTLYAFCNPGCRDVFVARHEATRAR